MSVRAGGPWWDFDWLREQLAGVDGNVSRLARVLQVPRSTLNEAVLTMRAREGGGGGETSASPVTPRSEGYLQRSGMLEDRPSVHESISPPRDIPSLRELMRAPVAAPRMKPWGLGGPGRFHLPPKPGGDYTILWLFDLHGIKREQALWDAALRVAREVQPDLTCFGGDWIDLAGISRWNSRQLNAMKPMDIRNHVRPERDDILQNVWTPLRNAAGGAVIALEGNHEQRYRDAMTDNPQEGWAESKRFFRTDEYLDGYFHRAGVYVFDDFLAVHGTKLGQYPAAAEFRATKCSGVSGHGHSIDVYHDPPVPVSGKRHIHTRLPAMCRLDAEYGPGNAGLMRWHQGVGVTTVSVDDPQDHVTDIGLWNGESLLLWGERYR